MTSNCFYSHAILKCNKVNLHERVKKHNLIHLLEINKQPIRKVMLITGTNKDEIAIAIIAIV